MKKASLLKTTLYLGVIVLLVVIGLSFNSLRVMGINTSKTIRVAQDRFKLDDLELQIKDAITNHPADQAYSPDKIKELDEKFYRYEQQLLGAKLSNLESIKPRWEVLKSQPSPDPAPMLKELDQLHRMVNKNVLEDIARRVAYTEKDITHLKILKITSICLIVFLISMGMYFDTILNRQREELLKRIQVLEKSEEESSNSKIDYTNPEKLKSFLEHL